MNSRLSAAVPDFATRVAETANGKRPENNYNGHRQCGMRTHPQNIR